MRMQMLCVMLFMHLHIGVLSAVVVTSPIYDDIQEFFTVPETLELSSTELRKDMPVNETLYLTCTANRTLKWVYKNHMMSEPKLLGFCVTFEDMGVKSTINLQPKSYTDTGRYSCVTEDTEETIGSIYIFVNQKDALFLPLPRRAFDAYQMKRLAIPCLVTNSQATVTLIKIRTGKIILSSNDSYYDPTKGFEIPDPNESMSGWFSCEATLNGLKNTKRLLLRFYRETSWKPRILTNASDDLYILVNSTLTLKYRIVVDWNSKIISENWTFPVKDTKRIEIKHHHYVGSLDKEREEYAAWLTIREAQKEDSGLYKYNITDHSDKWNYKEVNVHVLDPEKPHFTESNISSTVVMGFPGEEVELLCQDVKGFPKPKMKWYRDSVFLNDTNQSDVKFEDDGKKLIISRFHQNATGFYECWAENEYGAASRNITLLIIIGPGRNTKDEVRIAYAALLARVSP